MAKFPKKAAYVACNGGERATACRYGCMSCSSCMAACRKDAIFYNEYGAAQVDETKCVGCGLCVKACPQEIIHLHVKGSPFVVKCSNRDKGAAAKNACQVSCIVCGICRKNCTIEAVKVENSLAVICEDQCLGCGNCVIQCPRGAIEDIRGIIRKI